MRKRGLCCRPVSVCPSVCLSDTFVYCIHDGCHAVKLLSRPGSSIILVFHPNAGTQFQGNPFKGVQNARGWEIALYLGNGTRQAHDCCETSSTGGGSIHARSDDLIERRQARA